MTKKAQKAKKHLEFRNLIARDLNFKNLPNNLNSQIRNFDIDCTMD